MRLGKYDGDCEDRIPYNNSSVVLPLQALLAALPGVFSNATDNQKITTITTSYFDQLRFMLLLMQFPIPRMLISITFNYTTFTISALHAAATAHIFK